MQFTAPPALLLTPFRLHWAGLIGALLVIGSIMAYEHNHMRIQHEQEARNRLENHASVLAAALDERFHSIDRMLEHVRNSHILTSVLSRGDSGAINERLQSLQPLNTSVRTLIIVDAAGVARASSRPELVGKNFAAREYFAAFKHQPTPDRLFMSAPFITECDAYSMVFSRPIRDTNGAFAGVVGAILATDYLDQLMEDQHPHGNIGMAIFHGNGTVIKNFPDRPSMPPGYNTDRPGSFYRRHIDSGRTSSLLEGVSEALPKPALVALHTVAVADVAGPPSASTMIVGAGREVDDILFDWRQQQRNRVAGFLAFALVAAFSLARIHRRLRAQAESLASAEQDNRRTQEVLQRFIDHLPGTAYVKDANARTLMANRAFKTLLGLDPATMLGKTSSELFPGEFGKKIEEDDQRVLASGQTTVIEDEFSGRSYESTRFPIDIGDDRRWLGGIMLDITPRKQAESAMLDNLKLVQETNRKLAEAQGLLLQSEKLASVGQLAAGVAHEINNPVSFVNSNLVTLEQYLREIFEIVSACEQSVRSTASAQDVASFMAFKQEKDFDFIQDDIFKLLAESKDGLQRVTRIVRDLKDFSRPGDNEWKLADIHAGLDSTINIVWNELKYKCTLVKDYGDLPPVRCLPSQLNQVFLNLLVNAGQAIEEKGEIAIRTRCANGEISIAVRDTGKGIPPEHLGRIFDPFFTTKPVGKGTGLGLSLSYSIVHNHGGTIEVDSTSGKGSTFTVRLPASPPEPAGTTESTP